MNFTVEFTNKENMWIRIMLLTQVILNTIVLKFMWNWYMIDIFYLKKINIFQSFGIIMFFVIIKKMVINKREIYDGFDDVFDQFIHSLFAIGLCFLLAFLNHLIIINI